jgi:hypothetical protein
MRIYLYTLLAFTMAISSAYGQRQLSSTNFYTKIKDYDLSKIWKSDSIKIEDEHDRIAFPEPLGFIGENFQRFFIHYTSVTKSIDTPYLYYVTGKTRVKNSICSFKGQIYIQKAVINNDPDFKQFKVGDVTCLVTLYEDSTQYGSGVIKGELISGFYIDKKGKIYYDALFFGGDGFANNCCTAIWTSYKTGKSKKCNWGDYRIPESKGLDIGAGEFHVAEQYIKNGWENYRMAWVGDPDTPEVKKARAEESRKWWK